MIVTIQQFREVETDNRGYRGRSRVREADE
jgi:hypothetical protein